MKTKTVEQVHLVVFLKNQSIMRITQSAFLSFFLITILSQGLMAQSSSAVDTSMAQTIDSVKAKKSSEKDSTTHVKRLAEVIVSATRSEKNADEAGRSVTLISRDEISRSGANSIAELISMAEGVYMTGTNQNYGANQSIFLRGSNSNHTLIMIDGIPLSDPSSPTAALDLSELSVSQVERLEIIRGAHSTLYGSGAIGGVVNIVTLKKGKKGLNVRARGTAGSFGEESTLFDQNVDLNYTFENGVYFNWGFHTTDANGPDATVDTSTTQATLPRDLDGMSRLDFGGRAGIKNDKWDLSVYGRSAEKVSDIDDREFDDDDNYQLTTDREILGYSLAHQLDSGFSLAFNGAHSYLNRLALNDSSLIDQAGNYNSSYYRGTYSAETFTNELQANFEKRNYRLLMGGASDLRKMSQDVYSYYMGSLYEATLDSLDLESQSFSFFFLSELGGTIFSEKMKNFSLGIGGRFNSNNTFGSSFTYQLNPMLKIGKNSQLYGNLSSGYNAPSLYQLHSPERDKVSYISRGNVNLRPESSSTAEFGLNQRVDKYTGISLGFFRTVVTDVIEYVYLWEGSTQVSNLTFADYRGDTYLNLGTLTTEGVEVSARGKMGRRVMVSGAFSYLRGRQDFYGDDVDTVKTDGNHVQLYNNGEFLGHTVRKVGLTRRPVTARVSLTWRPKKRLFIRPDIKYVSKRNDVIYDYTLGPFGALGSIPVSSYALLDIVSGMKLSKHVSALVKVENVFNVNYSEIRGYTSRGRGFFFTVDYKF